MPQKPKSYNHKQQEARRRAYEKQRGSASRRGYGSDWAQASRAYIEEHPFCWYCEQEGRMTLTELVDHIKPVRWFPELRMDPTNWRSCCRSCNAQKAARDRELYS